MIACHHYGDDARVLCLRDGLTNAGAQRVDHADQAEADQICRGRRCIRGRKVGWRGSVRNGEHAVTGFGHVPGHCQQCIGVFIRCEHREHTLRGALYERAHPVPVAIEGRGELALGLERDFVDRGMPVPARLRVPAELMGHRKQRHVGRIAAPDPGAVAQQEFRFVAKRHGASQVRERRLLIGTDWRFAFQEQAFRSEALSCYPEDAAVRRPDLLHGQLIAGQRAGLVARD